MKPIEFAATVGQGALAQIDLVEFEHSFYQEAYKDVDKRPCSMELLALRLCAFVDLKDQNKMNIPFS